MRGRIEHAGAKSLLPPRSFTAGLVVLITAKRVLSPMPAEILIRRKDVISPSARISSTLSDLGVGNPRAWNMPCHIYASPPLAALI